MPPTYCQRTSGCSTASLSIRREIVISSPRFFSSARCSCRSAYPRAVLAAFFFIYPSLRCGASKPVERNDILCRKCAPPAERAKRNDMTDITPKRRAVASIAAGLLLCCALTVHAQRAPAPEEKLRYTGLLAAVARGDTAQVKALIAKGTRPNARDGYDRTPLHVAAYGKHHEAMR